MKPSTAAVLRMLRQGWCCGSEFLDARIARYSARLHELRELGHDIDRRVCENPAHRHEARMLEWTILSPADRLAKKPSHSGAITDREDLTVGRVDSTVTPGDTLVNGEAIVGGGRDALPGTRPHQLTLTPEMAS